MDAPVEVPEQVACYVTRVTLCRGRQAVVRRYNAAVLLTAGIELNNNSRRIEASQLGAEAEIQSAGADRRGPADRRKRTLHALVHGSFTPRRQGPRREGEQTLSAVDWHHPQWLAVALLTLLLCVADALLTIALLQRGAYEANPLMAPLVHGSPLAFAIIKLGLTSAGIVLLTLLARTRVFGAMSVGFILYAVLLGYVVLVAYEYWLLQALLETAIDPI